MNDSQVSVSFTMFDFNYTSESPYRCLNCKKLISYHMSFENLVITTDFISAQGLKTLKNFLISVKTWSIRTVFSRC